MGMKKTTLAALLIASAASIATPRDALTTCNGESAWLKYAEAANGDLFFYDPSRLEGINPLRQVCTGVRYKTSIMGASSLLSLLEIDCAERTEKVLQSTFFTDENWKKAAMKTDMTETPKKRIAVGSTTESLVEIICD